MKTQNFHCRPNLKFHTFRGETQYGTELQIMHLLHSLYVVQSSEGMFPAEH
jgi:hypothetical protein